MYNESKRDLFFLLIVSIALHLFFIMLLLLSKLGDSVRQYKEKLLADQQKKDKTAQVIFQQPTPKQRKKLMPKLSSGSPTVVPSLPSGAILPSVDQQENGIPKKKPIVEKQEKEIQKPTKPIEQPEEKKIEEKSRPAFEKKESITSIEPQAIEKKPEATIKTEEKKELETSKQTEKKLTLADIAKGFVSQSRSKKVMTQSNSSNHLITISGKNIAQATADQLKHERYIKKLFDCIDIAFKLHRRGFRFTQQPQTDPLKMVLLVDVEKTGNIASINLIAGSENKQFDRFMLKVVKDASRSFPPVPTNFKTDIYSLPIEFVVAVSALSPMRPSV